MKIMTISSGDSKGLLGCKGQTVDSNKYHFLIYIENVILLSFKIIRLD